jgi:uncharacterized membrane protein
VSPNTTSLVLASAVAVACAAIVYSNVSPGRDVPHDMLYFATRAVALVTAGILVVLCFRLNRTQEKLFATFAGRSGIFLSVFGSVLAVIGWIAYIVFLRSGKYSAVEWARRVLPYVARRLPESAGLRMKLTRLYRAVPFCLSSTTDAPSRAVMSCPSYHRISSRRRCSRFARSYAAETLFPTT